MSILGKIINRFKSQPIIPQPIIPHQIKDKEIKLEELINQKIKNRIDQRQREKAADLGICPNCLSTDNLEEIFYHELSGESKYNCDSCFWTGWGEGFDF